ncbi:MAG: polyribonucleotide nucleotidyltransferase [Candidatus Nealsonbacteria bacterium DGGOD1a]|jgi:polyribonucleotide nucleotidyltransferase|nr:MAG: polyribonucleotide nucleotidyltransferase [Candidatus Nealsonbacteria bacterium DGGOD1a]
MDAEKNKFSLTLGGKELSVEVNDLAGQANGSAVVRYGDTMVLTTAVMAKKEKPDMGFFPLMVDYEEKYYAAGKIKGPRFIKRETRPSDEAICNARQIDRSIRPLFDDRLKNEVQTIATVLSWDAENEPDILSMFGISCSLTISNIPWNGPAASVRVGYLDGEYIINPTYEQRAKSAIDVVFAGIIRDNDIVANMIEGGFDQAQEEMVLEAFRFAKPYIKQLIDFQNEIAKSIGKPKMALKEPAFGADYEDELRGQLGNDLKDALYQKQKDARQESMDAAKTKLEEYIAKTYPEDMERLKFAKSFFEKEIDNVLHEVILTTGLRPDGRTFNQLRPLSARVAVIPRTHGSALFQRGETKALSSATLGAPGDQQLLDGMEITGKKRFLHHYNFPPYSCGEVRFLRAPGRREIGHGMLAEKTLLPLIPSVEDFPYTIRVTSEIVSSNGSTSMAALSAATLALMDAGVPIKAPATGISMGLVSKGANNYKVLTDIQGPEDHHGDMDFKVAGTRLGINAIQMDVKIDGITEKMMADILEQGKKARYQILDVIEGTLSAPRPELSPYAPRIIIIHINPEKIREVIGPGGKMINEIIAETGVQIDIEDDGTVFITAEKPEAGQKATEWIQNITREVKVGEIFQGVVKRIMNFGAFVEILPGQEGMVHISKLADHRVNKVEDVVNIGDMISVKVVEIDDHGRINLSLKDAKRN